MSVFLDISAALDGNLNAMVGLPPVAWENLKYSPTVGTLYIRPTLIPGDVNQASLGDSGQDVNAGIYQIDVFSDGGKGKNEAILMADLIADQFKRGTELTYNSRRVRIRSAARQTSRSNSDGWFQIPVIITYIIYTEPRV